MHCEKLILNQAILYVRNIEHKQNMQKKQATAHTSILNTGKYFDQI